MRQHSRFHLASTSAAAVGLSVAAGVSSAVTVAIIGRFGVQIGVFPALVFTSTVGMLGTVAALLFVPKGFDQFFAGLRAPRWMWMSGLLGTFFGTAIIFAGPRVGITATIALAIAGQIGAGVIIDRFGIFGMSRIALTRSRILAIVLLAGGSLLALHR